MESILDSYEIQKLLLDVQLSNWDTDHAIRYIVLGISRMVRRNPEFFLSPESKRLDMVKDMNYEKDFPNIICKTLHELIRDVLATIGIKSKVVVATNTKIPLYALIVEGEHNRYFIDALHDLFRAQYNIQPVSYGAPIRSNTCILDTNGLTDLSLDYIREIDTNIGAIDEEGYFSDFINRIKSNFINRNKAKEVFDEKDPFELIKTKVRFISDNYLNLYPVSGPIERTGLHVYLRTNLFNKSERANYYIGNRIDKEGNPVYINIKYGTRNVTFEEVEDREEYSLVETTEAITPRTF